MTRKPQANNALDLAGGSYDVLKDDASPFGLGESCNRVGQTPNFVVPSRTCVTLNIV